MNKVRCSVTTRRHEFRRIFYPLIELVTRSPHVLIQLFDKNYPFPKPIPLQQPMKNFVRN